MSGINYLTDTNALIYLLDGQECMKPFLSERLSMSIISEMEILSYPALTEDNEKSVRGLLSKCNIIPVNDEVKEPAIKIRRAHNVKLPDAIVAATAMVNGMTLLSADKGFEKIDGLILELLSI